MIEENQYLNKKQERPSNKIFIKAKEQLYTFEKGTYNEELLCEIIPRKEYDEIIESCGKTMGQSWAEKRTNDQIKIPKGVIFLSAIAILLTIAYMILLYLSTTSENGTALFVISIICIASASIIVFGMSIYNFCRKIGKFKSLDQIIKDNLQKDFDLINSKYTKLNIEYDETKKQLIITVNDYKRNLSEESNKPKLVEMKKID